MTELEFLSGQSDSKTCAINHNGVSPFLHTFTGSYFSIVIPRCHPGTKTVSLVSTPSSFFRAASWPLLSLMLFHWVAPWATNFNHQKHINFVNRKYTYNITNPNNLIGNRIRCKFSPRSFLQKQLLLPVDRILLERYTKHIRINR